MRWAKVTYLDASALVKLVVDEGQHEAVRRYFYSTTNFAATSLCLAEALGAVKAKWTHGRLTEAQYFAATRKLVIDAWGGRIEVDDINLFTPSSLNAVEALAKAHTLDLSDALQLATIKQGKYAHLGPSSATVLITADARLARAAELEGIRAWDCVHHDAPAWA
jgi:predicted nucleic acid-binding protein